MDRDLLIRATVKNLSPTRELLLVELKSGECFEPPFPLQKKAGEGEDSWALKDDQDKTVMKLRFTL